MTDVPHLAFPPRVIRPPGMPSGVIFATVDEDSPEHLAQRVEVVARTQQGSLLHDPDFGVPDGVLRTGGIDMNALRAALTACEPDADTLISRLSEPQDIRHDRLRILIEEGDS